MTHYDLYFFMTIQIEFGRYLVKQFVHHIYGTMVRNAHLFELIIAIFTHLIQLLQPFTYLSDGLVHQVFMLGPFMLNVLGKIANHPLKGLNATDANQF